MNILKEDPPVPRRSRHLPALWLAIFTFWLLAAPTHAAKSLTSLGLLGSENQGPLDVEQAFVFLPEITSPSQVTLRWDIPERYYLYRDKFQITATDGIEVVSVEKPAGVAKEDPLFGSVQAYYNQAEVIINLASTGAAAVDGELKVVYQGCWEGGICYPPVEKFIALNKVPVASQAVTATPAVAATTAPVVAPVSEQDRFAGLLAEGNWLLILGAFFLAGLALSLTPCVFPMIPILSSIIAGQGEKMSTRKALGLSSVYVLAVAATYTLAGVVAGLFGENLQAAFQNPWIIGTFSAVFVLLSLSMFGFYDLQLPAALQSRLTERSNKQEGGTVTGVAVMGLLSALIVGPCMAAPLAGALIYIGQTGDPLLGGTALFMLSLGMGVPLLIVGASAGHLLPKAGTWMEAIKAGFGVMLLLMAIYMLDRIVATEVSMLLTAAVLIVSAIYMSALDSLGEAAGGWRKLWKGVGVLALSYGLALLIGVLSGTSSFLKPLAGFGGGVAVNQPVKAFTKVTNLEALNKELAAAQLAGKPVLLDFYADWCISCVELELMLKEPAVVAALENFVAIKVDVTANDEAAKALNQKYNVIGPPALIFYDRSGNLQPNYTVVGLIGADDFIQQTQLIARL